jgi:hypothetical protein
MHFSPLRLLKTMAASVAIFFFGLFLPYLYADSKELHLYTNNPVLASVDGDFLTSEDLKKFSNSRCYGPVTSDSITSIKRSNSC